MFDIDTCQQATLHKSQEEAGDDESSVTLDKSHAHAHKSPTDNERREVVASLEMFEDKIARNIDADVWNVENSQSNVEFIAIEVEIFNKAVDFGIADVTAQDQYHMLDVGLERHTFGR